MRSIVDHVVDGIISIDGHGTITTFNRAAERIFGYATEEVIGRNVRMLMPEPFRGEHDTYIGNYLRTGEARIIGTGREVAGRRSNGEVFPMELAISEFQVDGRRHFTGIVRDITERKNAEAARREAEERMRSVVDNVVDGIITIDAAGAIQSFNPAAERLFGYACEEVLGRNVNILMPQPYRQQHDGYVANYLRTGHARIIGIGREVVGQRKDGSVFPMELAVSEFHMCDQRFFTGIVRDITERKRLEAELRQRLDELADADRQKNEFLAMLGHELRNPLAPMRNALHMLKSEKSTTTMRDRARDIMERQLDHMVRLVDDLLDVSRIVRGKVELQTAAIDLREPVRRGHETALPVLDAHGHEVAMELPRAPVWVEGDMVRLSQVVANLLTNAAKYTGSEGQIALALRTQGDVATLTVEDTGAGIPPELLPRMFDLFVQGDRTPERAQGGLGIGLTLVRRLVDMHGGTVVAESGGLGQGSRFTVTLPVAPALQAPQPGWMRDAAPARGEPRVLVVDDNVDACESIAMILQTFGYATLCLYDGPSVLPTAQQWVPDAIVLDIGLPGMSGLEVAAQLRGQEPFARVPLLALTGYGQAEDRRRSTEAGFDLHLTKPVEPARLLQALAQVLAGQAA
ncbi:MAG TPA: PAS domain S-box protein [Ramlibacter sp.]